MPSERQTTQPSLEPSDRDASLRVFVSGQVQGVGYRYWLYQQANALNVTGWCRNLADGRVEAWRSGQKKAVDSLLVAMEVGPAAARVAHVETILQGSASLMKECGGFEIRR